ncbi:metal-dependent hydrolase [Haloferula sp. A504]|uniref:metal-dependent hydrolase n=1 Tax=Haloferula sp. A504 TaxID=3373601 RepID=UPI0031C03711|nr:metal-dependent hydrolase [Verrucomicrobiaceae bacterium E54]
MDLITQAALGATVGAAVLGPKLGRPAIGWGAMLGLVPDLDGLLMPFIDTAWDLWIHRGFSHSMLLVIVASVGLAKPLSKRWKRQKVTPQRAGWFVFLVLATHVLIDCFTVYGTQVLWPFSSRPVAFNNLFIIDPLFTLPLLVAIVGGLRIDGKRWKKGVGLRMTAVCLAVSSAYVGLSYWAKHAASTAVAEDLERRGIDWQRRMESPAPFSILLWRAVIERDEEFWVGYRSIFDGDSPVVWTIYPKQAGVPADLADDFEVRAVRRFSDEWWLARKTKRGVWLVDMRFGTYREWDKRGLALRPIFAWEYQVDGRGDPLKRTLKEDREMGPMLSRLWERMLGFEEGFDTAPRLIGNPATTSEALPTVR